MTCFTAHKVRSLLLTGATLLVLVLAACDSPTSAGTPPSYKTYKSDVFSVNYPSDWQNIFTPMEQSFTFLT